MINFLKQNIESKEVILSDEKIVTLNNADISNLIKLAKKNIGDKIRFCSHSKPSELIHEMFIIHPKDMYIRPHKHTNRLESMLVLSGEVDYILFDDNGNIDEIINMGDINSGKDFYISVKESKYHSMIVKSNNLVFLEITNGPFNKSDSEFAIWSPKVSEEDKAIAYLNSIKKTIQCK